MQKHFDNILEFTKLKEKCLFCGAAMRAELTNFIGIRENNLPILSEPIIDGKFKFRINHTTESYDVRANGVINIISNDLVLDLSPTPSTGMDNLDRHTVLQAFSDLRPHVDLYCPNKKCKFHYHLSSYIFDIQKQATLNVWTISPLKLFLESFKTGNFNIQNDWRKEETNIYSLINEDAEPMKFPIIDFEEMGKDKLLTRIKTLVVFS